MTSTTFGQALDLVLVHEGGYVNDASDPGGPTNKGITQRVYDGWRRRLGRSPRSVREITDEEVAAIYKAQYWNVSRCDQLPTGLDYAVFDFAVHSGTGRAAKFLQRIVGVTADGQIGEVTLAAVRERDPRKVAAALCDARLDWLKTLRTWAVFGKGWARRVADVKETAVNLAGGGGSFVPAPFTAVTGKADGAERLTATMAGTLTDPGALTALAAVLTSAAKLASVGGPVQWSLAGLIAAVGAGGVFWLVRKLRSLA